MTRTGRHTGRRKVTDLSYAARIDRVVSHIGKNLHRSLDLQSLADIACFSPFHFHRIYRLTMGETPDQTVRRLRLHAAAVELISTGKSPSQIARTAGYGSLEAFSRAFSATYGVSPTTYRAERTPETRAPGVPETKTMYDVTLKDVPAYRLAGFAHRGPYQEIGTAFERVFAWAGPRGLIGPQTVGIGVYFDDPEAKAPAELRSFAGLTVAPDVAIDGGADIVEIASGPAVSTIHQGPYADLPAAYHYLYGDWLPTSGREPADQPCFEIYLNNPRDLPPTEWRTEVFLPLQPE